MPAPEGEMMASPIKRDVDAAQNVKLQISSPSLGGKARQQGVLPSSVPGLGCQTETSLSLAS